jgi:hypothetical protein
MAMVAMSKACHWAMGAVSLVSVELGFFFEQDERRGSMRLGRGRRARQGPQCPSLTCPGRRRMGHGENDKEKRLGCASGLRGWSYDL